MKTILCYGDSNTYGFNPANGLRYPKSVRWTGRLQELLGNNYIIIEEGCNGRTTIFDDPIDGWKNGLSYLKPCLNTHKPIDIVILMLGSNDLKSTFHASAEEISKGAKRLIEEIYDFAGEKQTFYPEVILVSPPIIGDDIANSAFQFAFDESAIVRSRELAKYYQEVAKTMECSFFDAAKYVTSSKLDSLHLMPEEHEKLAIGLAEFIKNTLSKKIQIETKRLIMRPYHLQEMMELMENEADAEMKTAYGEMIQCMKENPGQEYWGSAWNIMLHDGTRVGDLCFKGAPNEKGEVEIGYGIDEAMQGNGYATEMVAAMIHWASVQPNVKAIVAETEVSNHVSQKVLKKNGFTADGFGEEGPRFVYHPVSLV